MIRLPGIHPKVDHRIVHGVAHRQPVDGQIDLLNVLKVGDFWIVRCNYEVAMERQPANAEYHHNDYHHLHNLKRVEIIIIIY